MPPDVQAWLRAQQEKQKVAQSVPFLSEEKMDDRPPSCSAADFDMPRLRRSLFDLHAIDLERSDRLGGGLDGFVWKVRFLERGPYVLKVFWDSAPLPECSHYYSAQRECRNAALLQMMEAAIKEAMPPILVNPAPKTRHDALDNTVAFSHEGRKGVLSGPKIMTISSIPRMRQWYG
ncbi:hypothetical protein AAE478_005301 [Parahypoxylon ruwenzoriense]